MSDLVLARAAATAAGALVTHRPPDAMHTILHTSRTTGLPKGLVYTDSLWLRNMVRNPSVDQVGFSYMPLAYITDWHTVYVNLNMILGRLARGFCCQLCPHRAVRPAAHARRMLTGTCML